MLEEATSIVFMIGRVTVSAMVSPRSAAYCSFSLLKRSWGCWNVRSGRASGYCREALAVSVQVDVKPVGSVDFVLERDFDDEVLAERLGDIHLKPGGHQRQHRPAPNLSPPHR